MIAKILVLKIIRSFEGTRDAAAPAARLDNVRQAATDFRRELTATPPVPYYRSFELVRAPYPTRFAYLNAYRGPSRFLHLVNRLFVVQFYQQGALKTLLVSPSDWEYQKQTPFFSKLAQSAGPLAGVGEALLSPRTSTVLDCLARIGLNPADVDYLTYDHLHTQNLRRWLGADGQAPVFPNAKLLVTREEWDSAQALLPWHSEWYCPDGVSGIDPARIALFDQDVLLGDSVALVRTRGHTAGNHSIAVHTAGGLFVTSENGVSLDSYDPARSSVPGVARYARSTGAEVVLNGNTLEYAVDQYISMVQEKAIAGPSQQHDGYHNLAPSSESAGFWAFPGTAPSQLLGNLSFGQLQSAPSEPLQSAA